MAPRHSRSELLSAATAFCDAFKARWPAEEILRTHFSSKRADDIIVLEHGWKQLAPFVGRENKGLEGARAYFALIAECLEFENMRFTNFVVDTETNQVSARGEAYFRWKDGQGWDEVFAYLLEFDDELKVFRYEIWADAGAAYLAKTGVIKYDEV
ncbi:hypothetical protein OQA88_580 [Cercophora sp. LCS_1]